jgi:MFS family permease
VTTLSSLAVSWLLGSAHVPYQAVFAVATVFALIALGAFSRIRPVNAGVAPRPSLRSTFAIVAKNRRFAVFQGALFLMAFGNIMGGTLYPLVIVDRLHAGYGPYGVLTVCSSLGYLISFFVWGRIVDRNGPFSVMGIIGAAVTTEILNMLFAPGVWWLLPVALLSGVVNAGFELGAYAASIHYAPPREVAQYMALHGYFSGIRGLAAPFLATALLAGAHYGRGLGAGLVICAIGTALLMTGSRREATGPDQAAAVPAPHPRAATPSGMPRRSD